VQLTPQAKKLWDKVPKEVQVKLLNNVYCSQCKKMVGIGNVEGFVDRDDLILKGICTACGGAVARVIEGS